MGDREQLSFKKICFTGVFSQVAFTLEIFRNTFQFYCVTYVNGPAFSWQLGLSTCCAQITYYHCIIQWHMVVSRNDIMNLHISMISKLTVL